MRSKYEQLVKRCGKKIQWNDRWVVNLSSEELSFFQRLVLSRGLNFAVAPRDIPLPHLVATIEKGLRGLPTNKADDIRQRVIGLLKRVKAPKSNISREEWKAIKQLRRNRSLVILPADKGRATVVIDISQYDSKMMHLISDSSTYKVMQKDPTPSLQRKMNGLLLHLKKQQRLQPTEYDYLRCSSGNIPSIYGVPKIHKPGVPLRPIVSFCTPLLTTYQSV